ncbi:MAG: hypothetical protein CTY23_10560 [Methylomonas sp.]|nr:MAG: hypothetical protein CTY23_10560 [Methylomonas sp.]
MVSMQRMVFSVKPKAVVAGAPIVSSPNGERHKPCTLLRSLGAFYRVPAVFAANQNSILAIEQAD